MLILTRRPGESVLLEPSVDIDPATPVAELFARGPIELTVLGVQGNQVRVGIDADRSINVLRNELIESAE